MNGRLKEIRDELTEKVVRGKDETVTIRKADAVSVIILLEAVMRMMEDIERWKGAAKE